MRTATRIWAAVAALAVVASAAGCATATDSVEPGLWLQVDAAEGDVYGAMTLPTTDRSTPEELLGRLSGAVRHWHREDEPADFPDDDGTAVVYDFRNGEDGDAMFDVFVTSGASDHVSLVGWLDSRPRRVYTCFRIEVDFEAGFLLGSHRSHDYGDERLACPPELVSALGDGARYREPWVFDG